MSLRTWFASWRYEPITQTEARERLKATQPPREPIQPTWRVRRKPKSIDEWKQQHERKSA
jgi:hypothetical protein